MLDRKDTMSPSSTYSKHSNFRSGHESPASFEDVYKPFITAPSPFQMSTHNSNKKGSHRMKLHVSNPYSQSLWFTSRGNGGEEVKKYTTKANEKPTELTTTNTDGKAISTSRSLSSLPVKMLNLKRFRESNKENESNFPLKYPIPSPSSGYFNSYINLREQYATKSPIKAASQISPKLVSIQRRLLKLFKIIGHLSVKFETFVEEEKLLCDPEIYPAVFGNVKTLKIIHNMFWQKLSDHNLPINDLEDAIYDHLQRLSHVYPSYFQNSYSRNYYTHKILKEQQMFNGFFVIVQKYIDDHGTTNNIHNFKDLINAPTLELERFLDCIDNFTSFESPRIDVLIQKIRSIIVKIPNESKEGIQNELSSLQSQTPVYLNISETAKRLNKTHLKDEKLEDQFMRCFRIEFKKQYTEYHNSIELIKKQVTQIAHLSTSNIQIARGFYKLTSKFDPTAETLSTTDAATTINGELPTPKTLLFQQKKIQSKYEMFITKTDLQNKNIYGILYEFDQYLSERTEELNGLCMMVLESSKNLLSNDNFDKTFKTEQLYQYKHFQKLLKQATLLILERFKYFIICYLNAICVTNNYDSDTNAAYLIKRWEMGKFQQRSALQRGESLNSITAKVNAYLVNRFFDTSDK